MNDILVYAIGFTAQVFFSARTLLQWIKTEKAGKVVSPSSYWVFSVLGSWLFFVYGWLRDDFSIILGQFLSYYIYLWNLNLKGIWSKLHLPLKILLVATPPIAAAFVLSDAPAFFGAMFNNRDIPVWMIIYGSAGQVIFTFRFIYQWFVSLRKHDSVLPAGFWIISLVGSLTIMTYGMIRRDPVLILGQSFGFVAYLRNIIIIFRNRKHSSDEKTIKA
ncbi:MAG: lipid-A-disaccharide synthase N-terminal domain-containing protein [Candidatus Cryptobacteroides sp.]